MLSNPTLFFTSNQLYSIGFEVGICYDFGFTEKIISVFLFHAQLS